MTDIIHSNTCSVGKPLIALDEGGQAPVIRYNLPQSTSYNAYSHLELNLETSDFKSQLPHDDFWDRINGLTLEEILQQLLDEIDFATENSFFENAYLLRKEGVIQKGSKRLLDQLILNQYVEEGPGSVERSTESTRILNLYSEEIPDDFFDGENTVTNTGGSSSDYGNGTTTVLNTDYIDPTNL